MKYRYLRGLLKQRGIDQTMVGRELALNQTSVSHRFSGRTPWKMDEMYKLLDICGAGPDQLHLLFPRDGIDRADGCRLKVIKGGESA